MRHPLYSKRAVFLYVVIFLIALLNVAGGARGVLLSVAVPVESFLWNTTTSVRAFLFGVIHGPLLQAEADSKDRENFLLRQEVLSLKSVQAENDRLKEALGFFQPKKESVIPVSLFGKVVGADSFFLDAGKREGVVAGLPVVTQSHVAVGVIVHAYDTTSVVRLLSDKESSVDVKVKEKGILGVLKGKGTGHAVLSLVPRDADLQGGDVISTASFGGVFPEDLLVGEVQQVEKSDLEAFQQASVRLFFDFTKEESLFAMSHE